MLPKLTFSVSLVKYLHLSYHRKFEKTQSFAHVLFNQSTRHTKIRKIARTGSSNKKYLKDFQNFLKREDFRKVLHYAVSKLKNKNGIALSSKLIRILSFARKDYLFSAFERS